MRTKTVLFGLFSWLLLGGAAARADLIFYQDRASFNAASTNRTVVDFEGLAPSSTSFAYFPTPPGLTLSGANFNIGNPLPGDGLNPTGKDFYAPTIYPSDFLVPSASTRNGTDLDITLPGGFTAIGLDLGSFNGGTFTFLLSTGDTFTETPASFGGESFIGFTSTVPITSLRISIAGRDVPVLDNFTFGAAVVPEPGTLALFGVGGLSLLVWGRRRLAGSRAGKPPAGGAAP
jgi:hypothetical protein